MGLATLQAPIVEPMCYLCEAVMLNSRKNLCGNSDTYTTWVSPPAPYHPYEMNSLFWEPLNFLNDPLLTTIESWRMLVILWSDPQFNYKEAVS